MKQQGKTWRTAEGKDTLVKYLPAHERLFEKVGQKIASEASFIESRLREAKAYFIDLCKEALRNNPDKGAKTRFTFYTFDKEFRIEFDIQTENVRVYRATKQNPSHKDYELINMDFNKSIIADEPQLITGAKMEKVFTNEANTRAINPFPRTSSATELIDARDQFIEASETLDQLSFATEGPKENI